MASPASIRSCACSAISAPWSHVSERRSCSGSVRMDRLIPSRTAVAPCPASGGPFFMSVVRLPVACSAIRGKCNSSVNRVVRSTSVPMAELSNPTIKSPSQWPGTARSSTSAGRALINSSGGTKRLPVLRVLARGTRNARPVRRHAVSSCRSAPRPWTYSA